jgi:hypothetical protein
MMSMLPTFPDFVRLGTLALVLGIQVQAVAGREQANAAAAQSATVSSAPPLPAGVVELKFKDFFRMPVGPRGLEMTPKLLALDGKRVRILGYMAHQEDPSKGFFILTPLPVNVAEKEDGMADDLPPATLFVHLAPAQAGVAPPYQHGLLIVTGTLSVGNREEADGRISMVCLQLDVPTDAAHLSH